MLVSVKSRIVFATITASILGILGIFYYLSNTFMIPYYLHNRLQMLFINYYHFIFPTNYHLIILHL